MEGLGWRLLGRTPHPRPDSKLRTSVERSMVLSIIADSKVEVECIHAQQLMVVGLSQEI